MNRTVMSITILAAIGVTLAAFGAEPSELFLGKSPDQWASELKSESAQTRHLAAWALAQIGAPVEASLQAALAHDDATVRFWGVHGLSHIAAQHPAQSSERKQIAAALTTLLADKSSAPRLAAAEAVARLGDVPAGLKVLVAALSDPQEATRVQAIGSLEKLGPLAAPVKPAIQKATLDPSEYVKRISTRLLEKLEKEP